MFKKTCVAYTEIISRKDVRSGRTEEYHKEYQDIRSPCRDLNGLLHTKQERYTLYHDVRWYFEKNRAIVWPPTKYNFRRKIKGPVATNSKSPQASKSKYCSPVRLEVLWANAMGYEAV
jgi:hypothetical protein